MQLLGELDDQLCILGGEPDQHRQNNLREDVVIETGQPNAGDPREPALRTHKNDRQSQRPAFVLRGTHQEYKYDREWKREALTRYNRRRRAAASKADCNEY